MAPLLTIRVHRVDIRLYRSSRTSADVIGDPAHFEYFLRCDWAPGGISPQNGDVNCGSSVAPFAAEPSSSSNDWWHELPQTYTVRRRWADIVKFQVLLSQHLAYDPENRCHRVKARMPILPEEYDIDNFMLGLAATGDACILSRRTPLSQNAGPNAAVGDLSHLHQLYVENHLKPYFVDVTKVLSELSVELLRDSLDFRRFVSQGFRTDGKSEATRSPGSPQGPAPAAPLENPDSDSETTVAKGLPPLVQTRTQTQPNFRRLASAGASSSRQQLRPASSRKEVFAVWKSGRSTSPLHSLRSLRRRRGSPNATCGFDSPTEEGSKLSNTWQDGSKLSSTWQEGSKLGSSWQSCSRLPHVSSGPLDPLLRSQPPSRSQRRPKRSSVPDVPGAHPALSSKRREGLSGEALSRLMRDICDGLRVIIFGETPAAVSRQRRKMSENGSESDVPTVDATIKVYRAYCAMLVMDQQRDPEANTDDESTSAASYVAEAESSPRGGVPCAEPKEEALVSVSWASFFKWGDEKEDAAMDFRSRSWISALNRNMALYYQTQATFAQRENGVALHLLFRWVWPVLTCDQIATMFTWVSMHEVEKIRQPTPRLMDSYEQNILRNLFKSLDRQGRGVILPEDVASKEALGGKNSMVDADTIRAVAGTGELRAEQFLELMCEENCRAHEEARRVVLRDGHVIVQYTREELGLNIWVLEDPSRSELRRRKLLDAIDVEIRRFRQMAQSYNGPLPLTCE